MLRLTLKGLAAHKARFALTTFAVVLAVSFVVSAFVLTDGLRDSFDGLTEEAYETTDLEIRPVSEVGEPVPLDPGLLPEVTGVDGVAAAIPLIEGDDNAIRPLTADGEPLDTFGPPQFANNWVADETLSLFTVVDGEAPDGPGQFTMDVDAADANGFTVGETYDLLAPQGRTSATLVGTTRFGEENETLGAVLMQFDGDWLLDLTLSDGYDGIAVALADGASGADVREALAGLSEEAEVVDQATLVQEQQESFGEGIDILNNVLLGFAGISMFVSIFIIYNTFSIVLGQRTRELALLRTIGADTAQVRRSVLGEALVVGVVASLIGLGAGVALSRGLIALFEMLGATMPDTDIVVSIRTVVVALVIGIGATLVSALGPARKAARVAPMAALRDGISAGRSRHRARLAIGTALTVAGAAALAGGLFAAGSTSSVLLLLAVGAIGVFVGITLISPLVARPLTAAMGWPLRRVAGTSGHLATENAGRNPHRTATTAAALMIGLALVSMVLVVGESVKAQFRATMAESVDADYFVFDSVDSGLLPAGLRQQVEASPLVDELTTLRYEDMEVDGEVNTVDSTDLDVINHLLDLDVVEGSDSDPSVADPVLISDEEAEARDLSVGDQVTVTTGSGASAELTIIGIIADDFILSSTYVVDLSTWERLGAEPLDGFLALSLVDGVSPEEAEAALAPISDTYPNLEVVTSEAYIEEVNQIIDQMLAVVNVLVALAVLIALIGIANTLALSVHERTRELGLLRAVGMTRRQVRRMIRFEAALVALFGAALGVGVGVAFGWAAVVALPAAVTSTLAVPVLRIVILVAVSALAGLVAAWGPARRAGRLNVLDAIAH